MKTLAQSYLNPNRSDMSSNEFVSIGRENLADIWSNSTRSWIEFCDGSVLDLQYGEVKTFRKLQKFHKNGVSY